MPLRPHSLLHVTATGLAALGVLLCAVACDPVPTQGRLGARTTAPAEPPDTADLRLQPVDLPAGQTRLRLGVTPYDDPASLRAQLQPVADHVGHETGVPVELVVADSYRELVARVAEGAVDLALLSPLSYVEARARTPGLRLLARTLSHGAPDYSSYVVVRSGDAAEDLADLRGRKVAFVDVLSTAGYLFPYAAFLDAGVDPETAVQVRFAGTHAAALAEVVHGRVDAAAIASSTLASAREGQPGLDVGAVRILVKTGRIPYDALCARAGLPESGARKIAWVFQRLSTRSPAGRRVLARARGVHGWIPAADADYDAIRAVLARVERHRKGREAHAGRP